MFLLLALQKCRRKKAKILSSCQKVAVGNLSRGFYTKSSCFRSIIYARYSQLPLKSATWAICMYFKFRWIYTECYLLFMTVASKKFVSGRIFSSTIQYTVVVFSRAKRKHGKVVYFSHFFLPHNFTKHGSRDIVQFLHKFIF